MFGPFAFESCLHQLLEFERLRLHLLDPGRERLQPAVRVLQARF
jgi:hypothetical protein